MTAATEEVLGTLSPSRAADFKACPLLYRFRSIDKIPQRPTRDKARGTVVHGVLELLFDLPAPVRTYEAATGLVPRAYERVVEEEPDVARLFEDGADRERWFGDVRRMLAGYFALEDPTRLEPAARELLVEATLDGLRLRGYVDRLDVAPTGEVRVVDYKTGSIPREAYEAKALFQLKFYALVLWRTQGTVPAQLRLMYLADRDTLSYEPDADELARFERTLVAVWAAIERAVERQDFRPNPSRLCNWCDHQALCPAFGGTPPPFPVDARLPRKSDVDLVPPSDVSGPAAS
jgi:putative RecB family exonuclease